MNAIHSTLGNGLATSVGMAIAGRETHAMKNNAFACPGFECPAASLFQKMIHDYLLGMRSDLAKTMDGAQRQLAGGEGR